MTGDGGARYAKTKENTPCNHNVVSRAKKFSDVNKSLNIDEPSREMFVADQEKLAMITAKTNNYSTKNNVHGGNASRDNIDTTSKGSKFKRSSSYNR